MPKLPALNAKQVIKILKKHGFLLDHSTGSHFIFYNPANGRRATVPFHTKDLPKGTLLAILNQAGLEKGGL